MEVGEEAYQHEQAVVEAFHVAVASVEQWAVEEEVASEKP